MIKPLPHWCLTDLQPAFYDIESATAVQQTAKLYAKIQELINDYNSFVDEINRSIEEFETGIIKDFDCFKKCIIKTMNDYIKTIDMKINLQDENIANKFEEQDSKIADAIDYMKTNLIQTVNNLFAEALENGDIIANLHIDYNSTTEALVLSIVAESEGE